MQINRSRGDTYADSLQVSKISTGEVVDISGCSFKMTLSTEKNPLSTANVVYQLDGSITDAVNGIVEFIPNSTQADNVGLFYFDIQMIDQNGIKRTLVKDVYNYVQDITKN